MFLNALSFLEEEREAWRPFEALDALDDTQLERQVEAAHGWSGRDLMAHLAAWQDVALQAAKELAVGERSLSIEKADADWDARGGEVVNEELRTTWRSLPLEEVRRRFRTIPGELRGYLTVVPEARWIKHADHMTWLVTETLDHYADHEADLREILAAAR
ncbi:MAG TPA: maleylpyruvate isomerase N-terminal domain-containing protein [Candidatus Dormibacteraeota bacterium]|nr:maleylpyruvate isomerase N-terminal domain-containing protein [Candidatus Dormibacteraeota bacterium]